MRKKTKKSLIIGSIIILLLVIGGLYNQNLFNFSVISGQSSCSYQGENVYETATCSVSTNPIPSVRSFDGVTVSSLSLEYAPDCVFSGSITVASWSSILPGKVLFSGDLVGERSGSSCIFFEPVLLEDVLNEPVIVTGTVEFVKEWHDCEVCSSPNEYQTCTYDTNWMRYQNQRVNYYCGGKFTDWKCKSYVQMNACEGQSECSTHTDCISKGGNACISGFCKNLILPNGGTTVQKDINTNVIVIISVLIIIMAFLGYYLMRMK